MRTLYSRGYLFDELDAINRRNFVSYGFTTRAARSLRRSMAARHRAGDADSDDAGDAPDVAVSEWHTSRTAGSTRPTTAAPAVERSTAGADPHAASDTASTCPATSTPNSHLANIDLGLRLKPIDYICVSYDASVNVSAGTFDAQNAALSLIEPNWVAPPHNVYQSPSSLSLSYRFVEQNVNAARDARRSSLFSNRHAEPDRLGLPATRPTTSGFSAGRSTTWQRAAGGRRQHEDATLGPHFVLREYPVPLHLALQLLGGRVRRYSDNFQTPTSGCSASR